MRELKTVPKASCSVCDLNSKKGFHGHDESCNVPSFRKESVRMQYAPLIREWITQHNKQSKASQIVQWRYLPRKAPVIRFSIYGSRRHYVGKVDFTNSKSRLRVEKVRCHIGMHEKILEGFNPLKIPKSRLESAIRSDIDAGKTEYINKVARDCAAEGKALFDILEFERIDQDAFKALWDNRRIDALCSVLSSGDFFEDAQQISESIIEVSLCSSEQKATN